jgi:uncharacterized membrane protein (GlpM family)
MTGTLWQILGILAIIALVVTMFVRPSGIVPVALAFAVVVAAIVVSWRDVEQYRDRRAATAAFQQENASASTAVTVPPPNAPHAGS